MSQSNHLHTMDTFTRFFQENQAKFLSFAYSYIRNKTEAEDILMESMIALWENRDKWENDSNLQALLLTIIKNRALNYLAHEQVRLRAEDDINTHRQRELNLRISTLEACEPDTIFNTEIQHIVRNLHQKCRGPYHQIPKNTTYRTKRLPDLYSFLKKDSFSVRVTLG